MMKTPRLNIVAFTEGCTTTDFEPLLAMLYRSFHNCLMFLLD